MPDPGSSIPGSYAGAANPSLAHHGCAVEIAWFTDSMFLTPSSSSQASSAFAPCLA